jgi:hypothetical protein
MAQKRLHPFLHEGGNIINLPVSKIIYSTLHFVLDMVIIEKLLRNIIILNYGQNLWLES